MTRSRAEQTTADHEKAGNGQDGADTGISFSRGPKAFIDRRRAPTRAGLICPDIGNASSARPAEARKAEFEGLAGAIRLDIVFSDLVRLREVKPATYLGGGYVETLAQRVHDDAIELLLVDAPLTPIQQRNLETRTGAKVLDRTALILEIFGERAATREGVLQVELAHLNYQKGRLVRSWTHLERQRGGGGFLGGPGETQIESDRRQLQDRIVLLEKRLGKVVRTRALQRKPRDAVPFPLVALVGYTNAGKSSLFNRMTGAGVVAKDLLFATLDTTVRKARLPHGRDILLSDTVGFIADLPTDLVAAFRATLEEVRQADIVLHVRDISNPDNIAQARDVLDVLGSLGVSGEQVPVIEVWNKMDLLPADEVESALQRLAPLGRVEAVVKVSAVTGKGMDSLMAAIETCLASASRLFRISVPHDKGEDTGWLYAHGEIVGRDEPGAEGTDYLVRVQPRYYTAFQERFGARMRAAS